MPDQQPVHGILNDYVPAMNSFNELAAGHGPAHADWERFFTTLGALGPEEVRTRTADILRLLKENGIAYNIYRDPAGETRPWELDPIPQIIASSEWQTINDGLIQRATLFNLMLRDLYGPQTLIREGIVPQELVYMHPGFLRSCMNIDLPARQHLVLYAADMGRGTDGRLWIISDRTQAPSGYGYALENRFALSSVIPEFFSHQRVSRLSPFFDGLQQALNSIAPRSSAIPRIVILTPGPENETYFEHSYLSSYLGLTLVQGNDLMVKDNFVWLKTIEGLEKVDVILRRMDDSYVDPLELRSESLLGVPGLLQVIRKGNVALANPLGSSIIENAGLMPFLHRAARHLLGEDLLIPAIATWWCGQPREMQYVIENLEHLVIRRIYRRAAGVRSAIDGASLSHAEREDLIREIRTRPHVFAGQEKINYSSTPSWVNSTIQPGHSLIRSFLVSQGNSFMAMPGGLTRTSYERNSFIISSQSGGNSKDTWVIATSDEPTHPLKLQLKPAGAYAARQKDSLPSHTAENLYWAGRYTERVIYNARLLRTVMQYVSQGGGKAASGAAATTRQILLQGLTHCTYAYPGFMPTEEPEEDAALLENPWPELTRNLYDVEQNGSLAQNLSLFRRAVYNVRNFLSQDTWRVVQQMDEIWTAPYPMTNHDHLDMIGNLDALNTSMFAFLGMNRESARREQEWGILDLGRKFERSMFMIRFLQNLFYWRQEEQTEYELIVAALTATQSMVTYRYTFRDHLQLPLLFELLILDNNYPKSLAYLVERIRNHVFAMPRSNRNSTRTDAEQMILEARNLLHLANSRALAESDRETGAFAGLNERLEKLYSILLQLHSVISKTYFKHTLSQHQLYVTNYL